MFTNISIQNHDGGIKDIQNDYYRLLGYRKSESTMVSQPTHRPRTASKKENCKTSYLDRFLNQGEKRYMPTKCVYVRPMEFNTVRSPGRGSGIFQLKPHFGVWLIHARISGQSSLTSGIPWTVEGVLGRFLTKFSPGHNAGLSFSTQQAASRTSTWTIGTVSSCPGG